MASAVAEAPRSSRSRTATARPSAASRREMAAPRPRAPPVTIATRLEDVVMGSAFLLVRTGTAGVRSSSAVRSAARRRSVYPDQLRAAAEPLHCDAAHGAGPSEDLDGPVGD